VRAARGELGAAITELEAALQADPAGEPFEVARSWLVLGVVQRRARRRAAARTSLTEAHERFDRLGTVVWTARAAAELERTGGAPTDRDSLTPTEHRVAALIAAGRTYREAADELFISPKTVQANLSKVYRKLGIRSRAELPARLPPPES
jgi:DNA-binding CsgD family transcriptional regulator